MPFKRSSVPPRAVFNDGQGQWGPSPGIAFTFDLTNPDFLLKQNLQYRYLLYAKQAAFVAGLCRMAPSRNVNFHDGGFNVERSEAQQYQLRTSDFDQSMVWFQNMEDPNEAFRGVPGSGGYQSALTEFPLASGHNSHHIPLPSSSNITHGNVRARRQNSLNPNNVGLQPEARVANTENIWASGPILPNVNQNLPQSLSPPVSQRWPAVSGTTNQYNQTFGFHEDLPHGLPIFPNNQTVGPAFDLSATIASAPNPDSSSSSSCRVNGSSPNTVFGSFSSSIGPPEMMDMDVSDERFHSPSVFPAEVSSCDIPGTMPQAFLPTPPGHHFPITPQAAFPEVETVSPSMLRLKNMPSIASSSSSESLHNPFRMDSDSDVASGVVVPQDEILSSSAWQARRESAAKLNTAGRKQLPDKAPRSKATAASSGPKRRHGAESAADKPSASSSKRSKPKTTSKASSQSHSHSHHHQHHKNGGDPKSKNVHGKTSSNAIAKPNSNSVAEASATPPRSDRDEFLVQSKLSGMTYKEIRKTGGFTEAESTLRGRFRTLTKPKEARVRKPEFQEIDDKLLKRAVIKFTKDVDEVTRDNVPWKMVAEYMVEHGGSYLFGYTTVRKRWEYLVVTSDDQVKQDRLDHKFQL
ncbi:hypothetical protein Daus18300_005070 [Diaporthe australafricana]|uniref:Myb-like domain-containing protein n=1 Tax=Diaporthe australafricana TaxID=127596 RepID=A0ABR3X504_9PEZI